MVGTTGHSIGGTLRYINFADRERHRLDGDGPTYSLDTWSVPSSQTQDTLDEKGGTVTGKMTEERLEELRKLATVQPGCGHAAGLTTGHGRELIHALDAERLKVAELTTCKYCGHEDNFSCNECSTTQ